MTVETERISRVRNEDAEAALSYAVASLRPGWELLVGDALRRDAAWSGCVEIALIDAELGVALLGAEPCADAVTGLKRALDGAGFREAFGGLPPIVYRVLPPAGLPLDEVLDAAFSFEPTVALSGKTEWTVAARDVLALRGAAAAGSPEESKSVSPPRPTADAETERSAMPAFPIQAKQGGARHSRRGSAPLLAAGVVVVVGGVALALLPWSKSGGPAPTRFADGAERTAAVSGDRVFTPKQPEPLATGLDAETTWSAAPTGALDQPEPVTAAATAGVPEPSPPLDATPPVLGVTTEHTGAAFGSSGTSLDVVATDSLSLEPPAASASAPTAALPASADLLQILGALMPAAPDPSPEVPDDLPPTREAIVAHVEVPSASTVVEPLFDASDAPSSEPASSGGPPASSPAAAAPESGPLAALTAREPEAAAAPTPALPDAVSVVPPPAEAVPVPEHRGSPPAKRRNERQQTAQGPQPPPSALGRCRSVVMLAQLGEELSAADVALMRTRCGGRQDRPQAR